MTSQSDRKDSHARGNSSRTKTLTKIVVLTSIVSSSHAFQSNFNTRLSVALEPVTSRIPQNPYYKGRRNHSYPTSLRSAALFSADGPSSELDGDAHVPMQEIVKDIVQANASSPTTQEETSSISVKDKILFAISGGLGIAALLNLVRMSSAGSWRYFLAGGVCAAVSHAIPTPIDVVKVSLRNAFSFRICQESHLTSL
jgi:hypothetical protein